MFRKLIFVLILFFAAAGPARAEWREASSRNFLVYSELSEADLRAFTEKLERFDAVLRRLHNVQAPPSPNRLRVFLLADQAAVARMIGSPGSGVAGYYENAARGVMMVGTRNSRANARIDAESVLLHEYTHHFMYHYFPATYPTWYSEGFAEFWGATRFTADAVEIGHPAEHRFASLNPNLGSGSMSRWLPLQQLLTAQRYADVREVDLIYAQGWLLVRYVWQQPERQRQLNRYLQLINDGASYAEAARQAFGNVDALSAELFGYARQRRFDVVSIPIRGLQVGSFSTRSLGPAEQALVSYEIRLSQGVPNSVFPAFATELRAAAARFPNDAYALRLLTEVERIAGNRAPAMAAAERLLAVAPNDPRGLMHRAMLRADDLRAAGTRDAAPWEAARRDIARAIERSPADPLLYEAYYDSFAAQGATPPEHAQAQLYRAHELAPSDGQLAMRLAADFEQRGMIREAIAIIRPTAYRVPPRDNETAAARARRERLEDRYRSAGQRRSESPREMLDRLQARLAQPAAAQPAAAQPGG